MAERSYKSMKEQEIRAKITDIMCEMPEFICDYINERGIRLTAYTLLGYTYKLKYFCEYLCENHPVFKDKKVSELMPADFDNIKRRDIIAFINWMQRDKGHYSSSERELQANTKKSIENYLSCLSAFWKKSCANGVLHQNPMLEIERPKLDKSDIVIHLNRDDKAKFMNTVEYGTGLSEREKKFHDKNQYRDAAICQLFLDTGARISELVGLNLKDLSFNEHCITVIRKGNKIQKLYFSDFTETYLQDYLSERESKYKPAENETALFLSRSGTRIGVRSLEKMVKKYVMAAGISENKPITPHKLRSTYAMDMYAATRDIEIVRSQLGHSSVATTSIYAKASDKSRIDVRNLINNKENQ